MESRIPIRAPASPSGDDRQLTRASSVRMELFAPPPAVAPFVTTFFRMRCDERNIRDVQPSSIGIVALMAHGTGRMRFLDGRVEPSHRLMVVTPSSAAATFEIDGPWEAFGAMLSPIGWASLTGLCAAEHGNHLYDGSRVLPAPLVVTGHELLEAFDRLSSEQMGAALGSAILRSVRPLPAAHVSFIKAVADWLAQSLSPDLDDLLNRVGYGPRQAQSRPR